MEPFQWLVFRLRLMFGMKVFRNTHFPRSPTSLALAIGLLVASAIPGAAQGTDSLRNHLYNRWQISVSGTELILATDIRVDPINRTGTEIDVESDLGMNKYAFEPRASLGWRFSRRHQIEIGYFLAQRDGNQRLTRDIVFADTTFNTGLQVDSKLGTNQAFLTYRYAISARERRQIGIGLGIGAIFLKLKLGTVVGVTDGGPDTTMVRFSASQDITGPTLSLGGYGQWRVGDRWYLGGDLRGIWLDVSNIKATQFEAGFSANYYFTNWFAIDLGYSLGSYRVTVERRSSNTKRFGLASGDFDYVVNGIRLGGIFVLK